MRSDPPNPTRAPKQPSAPIETSASKRPARDVSVADADSDNVPVSTNATWYSPASVHTPPLAAPLYRRLLSTESPTYTTLPKAAQVVCRNLEGIIQSVKSAQSINITHSIRNNIDALVPVATSLDDAQFLFVIQTFLCAMDGLHFEFTQFAPTFKYLITKIERTPSLYLKALTTHRNPHYEYFNQLVPSITTHEDQKALLTFLQSTPTISLDEQALKTFAASLQDNNIKHQFLKYLSTTQLTRQQLHAILFRLNLTNASDEMLFLFFTLAHKDASPEDHEPIMAFMQHCITPNQIDRLAARISH